MMVPLLTVFIDGLRPESLPHMPFLSSLAHRRRMRTILGYSIACHASMYSGVYPNKHRMWFVWQRAPASSPFRWLDGRRWLQRVDCLPLRLLLHALTARREKRTSFWGLPRIANLPLCYWPCIDVSEKRYWDEPGYLDGYPTIFDLLRAGGVRYEAVGLAKGSPGVAGMLAQPVRPEAQPWTYLFLGELDALSHLHTAEGPEVLRWLRLADRAVERHCRALEAAAGKVDIVAFSDHGHVPVREKVNPYTIFRAAGDDLNRYMHLVDANFARFWFRDEGERERVAKVLAELEQGWALSAADMRRYHVDMPDDRFGELIFYLDQGSVFSRTTFGFARRQRSAHGYLPEHRESDGVLVSNLPLRPGHVQLVDILPSLAARLGIPIPPHVDGRAVWG